MKISENGLEEEDEKVSATVNEQISSLSEDELYDNELNKEVMKNQDLEKMLNARDISDTELSSEINDRGRELLLFFKQIEGEMTPENEEFNTMYDHYDYFKSKVHEILTGGGETSLRGQKTEICGGEVHSSYNSEKGEYTKEEYVFFVNQDKFGKHSKPVNTRRKLNELGLMEFMSFLGNYKEEISETLSGYFKKHDKAMRICELIREYGYHENPPVLNNTAEMEIEDKKGTITLSYRDLEKSYTKREYTSEYYTGELKKIRFESKEAKSYGGIYSSSDSNKNNLYMYFETDDDEVSDNDKCAGAGKRRYKQNYGSDIGTGNLLKMIDIVDEIKAVTEEAIERREKQKEKFERFIQDFKEEFKTELMAMRLWRIWKKTSLVQKIR